MEEIFSSQVAALALIGTWGYLKKDLPVFVASTLPSQA